LNAEDLLLADLLEKASRRKEGKLLEGKSHHPKREGIQARGVELE